MATIDQDALFVDPRITADGSPRASVRLKRLDTLWFNTGTLCNLTCAHCYIESSPTNDRLAYITQAEVAVFLDEIREAGLPTREIGLTGGEPFMNPDIVAILEDILGRGFDALVLTNAMTPMKHHRRALLDMKTRFGDALSLRVSLDHFTQARHEEERGALSWERTLDGIAWLAESGFNLAIAGRTLWGDDEARLRAGYGRLFRERGIAVDENDPAALVLFPEMDETAPVPEITTACWGILDVDPDAMMCATSRMVVKRRGADAPVVLPCTLLAYDKQFELGTTLRDAAPEVALNHRHCAKFCVLGGGSCSA